MSALRDMLQPMIILIQFCIMMGIYQNLPHNHSSSLIVGIVEVLKQYPLARDLVHDKILHLSPRNNRAPLPLCGC